MGAPRRGRFLGVAMSLVALLSPAVAHAQGRIAVGARLSYVPLTSGDATYGAVHGWGLTAQVAVTLDDIGATEVYGFYTLVPRDEDPYNRAPRLQMAGAMLSISRGIESRLTGVGMVGMGIINYTADASGRCDQPFCSPEGGVSYPGGRHPTFILGVGLEAALASRFRIRADIKEHLPLRAGSGFTSERRSDIGVGLRYVLS